MKFLQTLFLLVGLIFFNSSCKNEEVSQSEKNIESKIVDTKTTDTQEAKPVGVLYRSNEVDRPALFSSNCINDNNPTKCSQTMLRNYIKSHIEKINTSDEEIKLREVISFTVTADGSIGENIRSISKKEVCSGCRDAAIKVISEMPNWEPAIKEGKSVAMSMTVPVSF